MAVKKNFLAFLLIYFQVGNIHRAIQRIYVYVCHLYLPARPRNTVFLYYVFRKRRYVNIQRYKSRHKKQQQKQQEFKKLLYQGDLAMFKQ